ncbi:CvpA family protein [Paenibacillus marinisediminis]
MWEAVVNQLVHIWNSVLNLFAAWNELDWLILIGLILCIIWGAYRGLRSLVLSLFGYAAAFIIAAKNYEYLIPWVRKRIFTNEVSTSSTISALEQGEAASQHVLHAVIAFSILFAFILLGLWLIRHLLTKMTSMRPIRRFDRYTGALLGIGQFICLWCIIYILLMAWPSGNVRSLAADSYWFAKTGEWLPIWFAEAVQWAQWL